MTDIICPACRKALMKRGIGGVDDLLVCPNCAIHVTASELVDDRDLADALRGESLDERLEQVGKGAW